MGRSKRRRTKTRRRTRRRTKREYKIKRNKGRTLRRSNRRGKTKKKSFRRSKIRRKRTNRKKIIVGGYPGIKQLATLFIAAFSALIGKNQANALPTTPTTTLDPTVSAHAVNSLRGLQSLQSVGETRSAARSAASMDVYALSSTERPGIDYNRGILEINEKSYRWESIYYRNNQQIIRIYFYYNIDDPQDIIWANDPQVSSQTEGDDESETDENEPLVQTQTHPSQESSLASSYYTPDPEFEIGSGSGSDSIISESKFSKEDLKTMGIPLKFIVRAGAGALITITACIVACSKLANCLRKKYQQDNVETIIDIEAAVDNEESELDASKLDELEEVMSPSPAEMGPKPEPVDGSKKKKGRRNRKPSPKNPVAFGSSVKRSPPPLSSTEESCVLRLDLAKFGAGAAQGRRQETLSVILPKSAWT